MTLTKQTCTLLPQVHVENIPATVDTIEDLRTFMSRALMSTYNVHLDHLAFI